MPNQTPSANYHDYQLLGVKPGCSAAELRATYKSLVKRWHPDRYLDRNAEKSAAEEKLKLINAAYARLCKDLPKPGTTTHTPRRSTPSGASSSQPNSSGPRGKNSWKAAAPSRHSWTSLLAEIGRSLAAPYSLRKAQRRWLCASAVFSVLILLLLWWIDLPHFTQFRGEPPSQTRGSGGTVPWKVGNEPQPGKTRAAGNGGITALESRTSDLVRSSIRSPRNGPRRPAVLLPAEATHFGLGSTASEVMQIQGSPQRINGQTWIYGMSDVTFKGGRVSGYNNFDASLRIKLLPTSPIPANPDHETFDIGAHRDEVLLVQGTPSRVNGNKWHYGLSEVIYKDEKVVAFNNFFNDLKILMKPKGGAQSGVSSQAFTIGSTQDEVLTVQGTPSSVQTNLWSYELSDVWFQNGKVRMVNDFSSVLKFRHPD